MHRILALCLPLVPVAEDWTALPLPSLCAPAAHAAHPPALWDGRHLRLAPAPGDHEGERADAVARLPVALVVQMLEEDARARGTRLEISRSTPLLLARGDAAALAAAHALLADLERAADAFDVELEVVLAPAGSAAPASDAPRTSGASAKKRVRAGEQAFFGLRETLSFVGSFEVEVAADSGVAEPVVGLASSGATVHVRALRIDGGRRIHLSGLLDLAELGEVERFDPQTSDLGILQQPRIASVQAVFAGVVESGQALELSVAGSGLALPDWTLRIVATTRPDVEPAEGELHGWSVFDLAFLAWNPPPLAPLAPGPGVEGHLGSIERRELSLDLSAAAIAAALEAGRSGGATRSASRAPLYRSNDLLFVPKAEAALLRDARSLVRGSELLRARSGRLEIRAGALRASLPVCEGFPVRFAAGEERPRLVDYKVELAPQTWMPVPQVAVVFDGLAVDATAYAGFATTSFWSTTSRATPELARDEAQLGRLQMLSRTFRADAARIIANQAERLVLEGPASAPASGLHLRLVLP